MPIYPTLNIEATSLLNTQAFLGLNRGLSIADGEMADMLNMTGDHYPVLATRAPRKLPPFDYSEDVLVRMYGDVEGMLGTDHLIVCNGEEVYVDGKLHALTLSTEEHMKPKKLVAMGAYVCIWPDKKYLNVTNPGDYGDMGAKWTAADGVSISAMMCRKDGTNYDMESITVSDTAPAEPIDQQLWLDTSGENDVLKQYSTMYAEWIQVATTYIKIQADGIGKDFKENDVIHLSGVRQGSEVATVEDVSETLEFTAEDFRLYSSFYTTHQGGTNWVSTTATFLSQTVTIPVTGIPDGAKITNAEVHVKMSPASQYGAKVLTLNGTWLREGVENTVPITVTGNGDVNLKFDFQSKNNATVSGNHGGTASFTEIRLLVTYEATATEEGTSDADAKQLEALNTTNIIYGRGDNYIIVAGLLHSALTLDNGLVAELKIPDLDYVCEANNRLWGCSYTAVDGTTLNEIRACALGDFRNWYRFMGISTDSYVMSVGSDGKFTGAFSLQGVPLIWKEDYLHKISGTMPSNFTLNTLKCRGVQDGSWRSLAVVNESLYYKSRADVMAYDGAMPYSVSEKLGTEKLYEAVGGGYRDKYYVSMHNKEMEYSTYVYDSAKGLWHKEDESYIMAMASAGGDLVMAIREANVLTTLYTIAGDREAEETFPWSVTFGIFGFQYEQQKYLSRFNIRAQMSAGSTMKMEIMYDSNGEWVKAGETKCPRLKTMLLPIIPRRCDHLQIRLSGTGTVRLYSIARVLKQGGDG